jgi:uracil-DNA glycosylase family protein
MPRATAPTEQHPRSLRALERAEHACERCDLHRIARVVPGVGPRNATIMLVGEQPGDREDRAGEPFVGPAGRLLEELLEDVGIDRDDVFLTNAVKRFRHHEKVTATGGIRRIHDKPTVRQQRACHDWLESEIEIVDPRVLVLLGSTAVQAVLGSSTRLRDVQGAVVRRPGLPTIVATSHPSAALRAPSSDARASIRRDIREALAHARKLGE